MSTVVSERALDIRRTWFYYGWVNVVIAAIAMAATFPGRTHGLGMFTESIKLDFELSNTQYGQMNLWATLIGALFCLPVGGLVDRLGSRGVLTATYLLLGGVVVWMSWVESNTALFVCLTLTRGFGQSALSVVSITLVAKWFKGRSLGYAMAIYSILMGFGFSGVAWLISKALVNLNWDWRYIWGAIGWSLLAGLAPLSLLLTRSVPPENEDSGRAERNGDPSGEADALENAVTVKAPGTFVPSSALPTSNGKPGADRALAQPVPGSLEGAPLGDALRTPAFWVFSLAVSFFGLISSGISLFNEEIFSDRGFLREVFHEALVIGMATGVISKIVAGWLAAHWAINRVLALSLALLMAALLALPLVQTLTHVYLYAVAMGISGGVIALVFFAIWGQAFGRREVGRIQGIAQMLTVLASAVGPLLFGSCRDYTGSYLPMFLGMAPIAFGLAVACWWTALPKKNW